MTIKTVTSSLRNRIKEVTGDTIYTTKFLWNTILSVKRLLMERNKWTLSDQDLLNTVSGEPESVEPCEGCGVDTLYRIKTPYVLSTKFGPAFGLVGSEDGNIRYQVVTRNTFYRKIRLHTKGIYAYYENGYLYFLKYIPCISASYMAEMKPNGCSILDADACLPQELMEPVLRMSLESLGYSLSKPQDVIQNKNPNQ